MAFASATAASSLTLNVAALFPAGVHAASEAGSVGETTRKQCPHARLSLLAHLLEDSVGRHRVLEALEEAVGASAVEASVVTPVAAVVEAVSVEAEVALEAIEVASEVTVVGMELAVVASDISRTASAAHPLRPKVRQPALAEEEVVASALVVGMVVGASVRTAVTAEEVVVVVVEEATADAPTMIERLTLEATATIVEPAVATASLYVLETREVVIAATLETEEAIATATEMPATAATGEMNTPLLHANESTTAVIATTTATSAGTERIVSSGNQRPRKANQRFVNGNHSHFHHRKTSLFYARVSRILEVDRHTYMHTRSSLPPRHRLSINVRGKLVPVVGKDQAARWNHRKRHLNSQSLARADKEITDAWLLSYALLSLNPFTAGMRPFSEIR